MKKLEISDNPMSGDQLMELVKVFDGFSKASSTFAQSYRLLEEKIIQLSSQLEEQTQVLNRTEGFLASVLSHVPVGILVVGLDENIALFNSQAEIITGFKAKDVVGKPYNSIFQYSANEPQSALFTLANGSVIDSDEKNITVANGEILPVRFSTSWVYDSRGNRNGVLEVLEDLRGIRELQARMQRRNNLAALGEMAAQVAHELRNPLAGVQGFAQFMIEDIPDDHPTRMYAEKIISGVKDIDHIASRLLEFTNPLTPEFEKVDLIPLLESEGDIIQAEIHKNKYPISFFLKLPKETVPVMCDPRLIKQAVLNLLKNAVTAIPEKGDIVLTLNWDLLRNRVRIIIQDTGIGIEKENVEKIFNPFFTTRTRGTGLGLALVKKIIDLHGGDIHVSSTPGIGSMFVLELMISRVE